ncbi:hypothetical protein [Arthrobacter sp. H35-D1]|nr:hypothetical protein [Arthrobacter sp. H35-D1]MDJ0315241.1 hypothetical protein [Arthrobacter sp. H35-D1]
MITDCVTPSLAASDALRQACAPATVPAIDMTGIHTAAGNQPTHEYNPHK